MKESAMKIFHTFWQAAVAYFMVEWNAQDWVFDPSIYSIVVGALAAGATAVKEWIITEWNKMQGV